MQQPRDVRATILSTTDLPQLRELLRAAVEQYGSDATLKRALIHAEGAIADRLGEHRSVARRSERRPVR